MASASPPSEGDGLAEDLLARLETFVDALADGAQARVDQAERLASDADIFAASVAALGWSVWGLALAAASVSAATLLPFLGARRLAGQTVVGLRRFGLTAAAALMALVIGALLSRLLSGGEPISLRVLRAFALAACVGGVLAELVDEALRTRRIADSGARCPLRRFKRLIEIALVWSFVVFGASTALRLLGAGPGLRDAVTTLAGAIPVTLLMTWAYISSARQLTLVLAGFRPRARRRVAFARLWPVLAPGLLITIAVLTQIALMLERPLRPLTLMATVLVVLIGPHLDLRLKLWAVVGHRVGATSVTGAAAWRTARLALLASVTIFLIVVWGMPFAPALGLDLTTLVWPAIEIAVVVLVTAFLWTMLQVAVDRALAAEQAQSGGGEADEGGETPRSRFGTVLPLIVGGAKASLLALSLLTVLLALGVNVWPLVTGLSVFGLAIGFGSQALVKDVVSGLFFLADDALRLGEYVETSGAKGTVEKISIRSVSLRHPRGALATIPYGQIGKIQNFSRDWVIEKIAFRVAFDTDAEKMRKLFKRIGQEVADDPELSPDLIEPFKSQGIAAVEDGTLVIRAKFKARAGKQFQIRKRVLAEVHRAFRENGIAAVPKPLTLAGGDEGPSSRNPSAA